MFKNIFRVLFSNFWVVIIGLLSSFIYPKILSIDDYAAYQTFILYLSYTTILHLGLPTGMVLNYAGTSYEVIDKRQYKCEIIATVRLLFIFSIFFLVIALLFNKKILIYIALSIIPVNLFGIFKALYQAWQNFKSFTILNMIIPTSILFITMAIFVLSKNFNSDIYILIYIFVHICVMAYIMFEFNSFTKGIKPNKILTKKNINTAKNGFTLMVASYIGILFYSIDKQFIKMFFDNTAFALYSFGISMQSIMTIFITSISQPLFPKIASGELKKEDFLDIRNLLFVFGSLSGCAYFGISIIISLVINKYVPSLTVIRNFFAVFPAMAVVNCLYINLYKTERKMKLYLKTLILVLIISFALNGLSVLIGNRYYYIALATTITYYIWLIIGARHFSYLKLKLKDVLYLITFMIAFFVITFFFEGIIGFFIYLAVIMLINLFFYYKVIKKYILLMSLNKFVIRKV
jgi:O-antigen/teichoic acid export membrane protein